MRITVMLLTCMLVQVHAASFAQRITISKQNSNVHAILEEIRNQGHYDFFYDTDLFKKARLVTIDVKNATVEQVLQACFAGQPFSYVIKNRLVVITEAEAPAATRISVKQQQPGRVTGKVLDEKGDPLPGATIKVTDTALGTHTAIDGSYALSLPAGSYTLEISFVSYQTQRVTGVEVTAGNSTVLEIALQPATRALEEVVVTATFERASVEGLYAQQKNTASVTDGISSDQIARTPDNNIGQVLKRVSGVTTVDNKYVVVRGLSERYNQAMVDGIVLPSTSMNRRNFSFDVVPQELVSSVVVNKTATPDMSAEFSGGQVSVNTMDIPTENFTTITIGTGINSQSTDKNFLMLGERKGLDYLGISDHRKEPAGLRSWYWHGGVSTPPLGPDGNYPTELPADLELMPNSGIPYTSLDAIEQSRKLNAGALYVNGYKTLPFQNARLALGRVYDLKNDLRFGFSGGATYRNQQTIVVFNNVRGQTADTDHMESAENNPGTSYRFNSTIGAGLNFGLQGKNFKIALKNLYSHIFQDQFNETYRINYGASNEEKSRELFQDPQATGVWQHKLEGQNLLDGSGVKVNYTLGITRVTQQTQDQRRLKYRRSIQIGEKEYFQRPDLYDLHRLDNDYDYRMWTDVKETDYNWGLSFSKDFTLGSNIKSMAKLGYSGWHKHRTLALTKLIPFTSFSDTDDPIEGAYWDILSADKVGAEKGQAYYWAEDLNGPTFDGSMVTHAPYLMLDQRFVEKLRLVYGVRAEHYNLANRQEEYIVRRYGEIDDNWALFSTTGEKDWRLLPSANLTYSLTPTMNARLAYSKTAIRPDFRETAYFGFYDFELNATITGRQLVSTIVDNFDLRYEWYPSAGEVISLSGFYKKMKDPIELVFSRDGFYSFQNQYAARNYGVEMEIRKSLGFIADKVWLRNITLFGNGTVLKSKVEVQNIPMPGENWETERLPGQDRPLYGQAPWIVNGGIAYQDKIFGFTVSYNRSGHRTNTIHLDPALVEYENGRNLLDVQVSTRLLKQKAELKLDVSNLLDEYILFYQNVNDYEQHQPTPDPATWGWNLKGGSNTAYDKSTGDRVTYRAKTGRNIALSITYKF